MQTTAEKNQEEQNRRFREIVRTYRHHCKMAKNNKDRYYMELIKQGGEKIDLALSGCHIRENYSILVDIKVGSQDFLLEDSK